METVQQNVRVTLFSTKFHSDIYSILYDILFILLLFSKKQKIENPNFLNFL